MTRLESECWADGNRGEHEFGPTEAHRVDDA